MQIHEKENQFMTKIQAVFWGASGHAKAVANAVRYHPDIEIVGYLDDVNIDRHGQEFEGKTILGGCEQLDILKDQGITSFILGFGHCSRRIEVGEMLIEQGFSLLSIIHPMAVIASDVTIDTGVVVLAGAVIDPGCRIGKYTIINNGAIISHECVIGKGVHVCPGAQIAGKTVIGQGCWLGIGSTIIDKINIGDNVFIGAGSVVTKEIPSGYLIYGCPAKIIRKIDKAF
jgi:sugar O-acyltransferase (sialic acid O-acetyltransferase NeuD family)